MPGIDELWEARTPVVAVHANRFNNKIAAADINVEVIARSSKPAAVRKAQNVQNFFYELYHDWKRPVAGRTDNPNRRAIDQTTSYGLGIRHPEFKGSLGDLMGGKYREALPGNPFILECPSIHATFWEPDGSVFAEVGERTISSLVQAFGPDVPKDIASWYTSDTLWESESSRDRKVKVYRLETREYIYTVCEHPSQESAEVEVRPNPAGRPWYVLAYGNLTSHSDPQFAYQPLIADIYPLAQTLNVLETMLKSGALQAGKPVWQVVEDGKGPRAADFFDWMQKPANERPAIRIGEMETFHRNEPGTHLELLPTPDYEFVLQMQRDVKQDIRDWGFPPPLSPDLNVSAKSGYDRTKMQEPAAEQLKPALEAYASSWREMFILVSEIIIGLKEPITIPVRMIAQGLSGNYRETITIRPDDFAEQDISVSFDATPASAKYPDRESNIRMVTQGFMSKETFMKAEYDDNVTEQERIDQERLGVQMDAIADQDTMEIIMALRPQAMMEVAAEEGLPLATPPPEQQAMGGPAPGEDVRMERPPDGGFPGTGAPLTPPPQAQNGVPPDLGAGVVGVAP